MTQHSLAVRLSPSQFTIYKPANGLCVTIYSDKHTTFTFFLKNAINHFFRASLSQRG